MKRIIYVGERYVTFFNDQDTIRFNSKITLVNTVEQLDNTLSDVLPDLVIADYDSLNTGWLKVHEALQNRYLKIPFIVLATDHSAESAIAVFRSGADNYILEKDIYKLPEFCENYLQPKKTKLYGMPKSADNNGSLAEEEKNFLDNDPPLAMLNSVRSKINQIIARTRDEYLLYEELCSIFVAYGDFSATCIIIPNPDQSRLDVVASADADQYDLEQLANCTASKNGLMHQVLTGKKPFAVLSAKNLSECLETDENPSRITASLLCLPLKKGNKVFGTFNLFARNKHHYSTDEIKFLLEMSSNISFAVDVLSKERARKGTERRLEIENAKLKQAQASANLGTWEVDFDTKNATWSEELLRMYGLPTDNKRISLNKWLSMVHPDDRQLLIEARKKTFEKLIGYAIPHRIIKANGELRHLISRTSFTFDLEGNPTTLLGLSQDITDVHEITEALQASEQAFHQSESRYRQIVELANDGICLLNEQNQVIFSNNRLSKMIGYTPAELVGKDLFTFIDKKSKDAEKRLNKHRRSGEADQVDICFINKDGSKVWTSTSLSPVADDKGHFQRSILLISDISERRIAEERNIFKAHLLNNIGQAVIAADKHGKLTYWNKAAETLFNKDDNEVIGQNAYDLAESAENKLLSEKILKLAKKGEEWRGYIDLRDENGLTVICSIRSIPIYDDKQKYDGVIGIVTDVTSRIHLQRLLQSAVELAKLGHFEYNLIERKVFWSDLKRKIHEVDDGYVPDFDTAINFYKEGESREAMKRAVADAKEHGKDWDLEVQFISAKGNEIWVRCIGQVDKSDDKIVRIYGSLQDINTQKLNELALYNAYQERNSILESIGDAFFAVDQNWQLNYWNSNATSVLDKAAEDVIGKNLWEVYPEYIGSEADRQYRKVMETKVSTEFEAFFHSFEKWLHVAVYPSSLGLSIYFKDITSRKLAEFQLKELNENLQEYTKELMVVNTELEQFSYIVSHNLRAPVANIMGLAEELTDESYDAKTRSMFIDSLRISASRLNEVITDLSFIVQIKTNHIQRKEFIDLRQLTESVFTTISHLIKKENVQIETDFQQPDIVTVKSYLHSIIFNLISNSIKYRKATESPIIKISSKPVADGIEICVKDNGIGIDLTKKSGDMFKMYRRFHSHVDGKGIGLYMVKTQVEILEGTISVESAVDQGSVFKIFIPQ